MIINHNIAALNTSRALNSASEAQSKSMEKLSSGLRINRAGDDAAGLAISEKMRGQIRGLDMASRNAQDGISLIQTTEGALNETHSILQRMRELAVQSSNDTNTDADRAELQKEVDQLSQEISRIGANTEFNTQKLLDGSFSGTFHIGANSGQNISVSVSNMTGNALGVTGDAKLAQTVAITDGGDTTQDIAAGTYKIDGNDLKDADGNVVASTTDEGTTWATANGDDTIVFANPVTSGEITIAGTNATGTTNVADTGLQAGEYNVDYTSATDVKITDANGKVVATSGDGQNFTDKNGETFNLGFAIGADTTLSVGGTDITNAKNADAAITVFDKAIETVSAERSKLGAVQNRLEHTINNLGASSENLTAAESRVRDVDMAAEMVEQTKNSILSQAAQAMLAQANQKPQAVLQLLQ
ncbi:flagellin [Paenibacillus sp. 453mf]|uniref:flagellin N-terminal helical domain-containing protein n=1 Tax=Paenibacillus sp. 453mf TaxID=1761874 RepID=UPI0008E85D57|nr:flagellin [Paenibacillus sp. 453mf]SFS85280.1 flagellin [Paenibacillus sp. 453mf]